jgi:uncharacterized membrane protein YgcG
MLRLRQALAFTLIWIQFVSLSPLLGYAQGLGDTRSATPTTAELQQLVAPIALYPDSLVGQILAASSYPTQIVEAQRWLQGNAGKSATQIAQAADSQSWDPSVKSLTAFPKVLDNMNTNLAWTSALGEAYYSDPQGVLKTVQVMRAKAQAAGSLQSNDQQKVVTQGQTIIIEPANPQVIYVPQYNPTVVYGAPVAIYPGYSGADLAMTGILAFGAGIAVGALIDSSDGWGSNNWNCNWNGGGNVSYNHNVYVSNSNNYHGWNSSSSNWNKSNYNWNKNNSSWNNANRNQAEDNFNKNQNRNLARSDWNKSASNFNRSDRGYGDSGGWGHSDAFSGSSRPGGNAWADSDRGRSSFGGWGGRGGGGGFGRGGGFGGGGFRGGRR